MEALYVTSPWNNFSWKFVLVLISVQQSRQLRIHLSPVPGFVCLFVAVAEKGICERNFSIELPTSHSFCCMSFINHFKGQGLYKASVWRLMGGKERKSFQGNKNMLSLKVMVISSSDFFPVAPIQIVCCFTLYCLMYIPDRHENAGIF